MNTNPFDRTASITRLIDIKAVSPKISTLNLLEVHINTLQYKSHNPFTQHRRSHTPSPIRKTIISSKGIPETTRFTNYFFWLKHLQLGKRLHIRSWWIEASTLICRYFHHECDTIAVDSLTTSLILDKDFCSCTISFHSQHIIEHALFLVSSVSFFVYHRSIHFISSQYNNLRQSVITSSNGYPKQQTYKT